VEEGETAVAKSNYLYVDNVVNNKNIEYFTYPKLGSFMVYI
jgi:hypothetical protein